MSAADSSGGFRKVEDRYAGYDVVDLDGAKVGRVDHTFVDEGNQREYIAVKRGLAGLLPGTGSSIIPMEACAADNTSKTIQVNAGEDVIKNSPSLGGSQDMTPEYESQVRTYFRL